MKPEGKKNISLIDKAILTGRCSRKLESMILISWSVFQCSSGNLGKSFANWDRFVYRSQFRNNGRRLSGTSGDSSFCIFMRIYSLDNNMNAVWKPIKRKEWAQFCNIISLNKLLSLNWRKCTTYRLNFF